MSTEPLFDFDLTLTCGVEWQDPNTLEVTQCQNKASWGGMCHDEVEKHDYRHLLFCGQCYLLAATKMHCSDDGAKLLVNIRKL